jgi:hypothetical protein
MTNQCIERVIPREPFGSFHPSQCSRRGQVEREGKWYCKQHDPVAVAERRAASLTKYEAERDERNAARQLQERKNAAWEALKRYPDYMINAVGVWVWPDPGKNGYYGTGTTPWEAIIAAAYAAEIGEENARRNTG